MRNWYQKKIVFLTLAVFFISGCYPGKGKPEACLTDNEINTEPVLDLHHILTRVDEILSGYIFEAHCINIAERFTLSVWLVDPQLNPAAEGEEVTQNSRRAVLTGTKIALLLLSRIPSLKELFDGFNPMIVDRNFNAWYRDVILMDTLIDIKKDKIDEKIISIIERNAIENTYIRRLPPEREEYDSILNMELWQKVRSDIRKILGEGQIRTNTAAYIINQFNHLFLQVYLEILIDNVPEKNGAQNRILQLIESLAFFSLPLDSMGVYFANDRGQLQFYSSISGSVIKNWNEAPITEDKIMIRPMVF
jgi:hypothetical protein